MSKVDDLVKDFLAQKKIAVVGVSDKRDTGCNAGYKRFKEAGYEVYAVNPRITTFEGAPCYPDLKSIPDKPDAVFILANPKVTEQVVQQCVELGVKRVWMHCMMGTRPGLGAGTSVSQDAVRDVPRERHHGDPRHVSQSILEARLLSRADAQDVARIRISQDQRDAGCESLKAGPLLSA